MSVVTNILLTGRFGVDPVSGDYGSLVVNRLNEFLAQGGRKDRLVEVSYHAGGTKCMETNVWLGAFNYLDNQGFIKVYVEAYRELQKELSGDDLYTQLFIQKDEQYQFFIVDPETGEIRWINSEGLQGGRDRW